ncbi:hypothetical protein BDN72DRAFT_74971 [Pluteus cervinus]|uniref:Uncharacterized protein n=1 Tax=Pluteus cervinus TaxID=181527 RepID=A0ACD3APE8_9AGAR|nr:hypothetical protein BDN72DRAFT_74971 [Pluteus cervinus]
MTFTIFMTSSFAVLLFFLRLTMHILGFFHLLGFVSYLLESHIIYRVFIHWIIVYRTSHPPRLLAVPFNRVHRYYLASHRLILYHPQSSSYISTSATTYHSAYGERLTRSPSHVVLLYAHKPPLIPDSIDYIHPPSSIAIIAYNYEYMPSSPPPGRLSSEPCSCPTFIIPTICCFNDTGIRHLELGLGFHLPEPSSTPTSTRQCVQHTNQLFQSHPHSKFQRVDLNFVGPPNTFPCQCAESGPTNVVPSPLNESVLKAPFRWPRFVGGRASWSKLRIARMVWG